MSSQYPNLFTDISFIMGNSLLTDEELCDVIRDFETERVFFGSDFPWVDPDKDVDRLLNLKLSDTEFEMVSWKNAATLFEM